MGTYLPNLTAAFGGLARQTVDVATADFVDAVESLLPIFDHLGPVFAFAKSELTMKNSSIRDVKSDMKTLREVIEADKKAGTLTTKDSCARNLHRLLTTSAFVAELLRNLASDAQMTLRNAAAAAYDATLAPYHTYLLRAAVKASMYMLPYRENFLQSIGETEVTAREHCDAFCPAVSSLVSRIKRLYGGVDMPRSETNSLKK